MKKQIAITLLLTALSAFAQQQGKSQEQDPILRSQQAIERALAEARAMQGNQKTLGREGFAADELRKIQGVDPATLAARYQGAGIGRPKPEQELMVFVSTSMPRKALQMLGEQANAVGAVLVLRGLKGRLGTKGVMQQTMEALQPVAMTGASIQIDPEAFSRYNVTGVPTFVIATREEECAAEQCDTKAFVLAGDVSLEYALEQWSSRGGAVGRMADIYLKRMETATK